MKTYAIISVLMLFLCAFQCENVSPETTDDNISVFYGETQCADPWQRGNTDTETLRNAEAFMRGKNIRFTGTTIVQAMGDLMVCQACTCASGRTIQGTVHKDDLAKIAELGFSKKP
jgi:hypothetical protein